MSRKVIQMSCFLGLMSNVPHVNTEDNVCPTVVDETFRLDFRRAFWCNFSHPRSADSSCDIC